RNACRQQWYHHGASRQPHFRGRQPVLQHRQHHHREQSRLDSVSVAHFCVEPVQRAARGNHGSEVVQRPVPAGCFPPAGGSPSSERLPAAVVPPRCKSTTTLPWSATSSATPAASPSRTVPARLRIRRTFLCRTCPTRWAR